MDNSRIYFAIDLKSFYASVELCERALTLLPRILLLQMRSRTEKTICLGGFPFPKKILGSRVEPDCLSDSKMQGKSRQGLERKSITSLRREMQLIWIIAAEFTRFI